MKYYYIIQDSRGAFQGASNELGAPLFANKQECLKKAEESAQEMTEFYGEKYTALVEATE